MACISVLIVEDSAYSADLNSRELRKAGYTIQYQIVSSEQSMKTALSESKWDLILSDNSMPGFSALKALGLRNDVNTNIPFIIISEEMNMSDIETAFQEGCAAFVSKEKLSELRNIIGEILETRSRGIRIGI